MNLVLCETFNFWSFHLDSSQLTMVIFFLDDTKENLNMYDAYLFSLSGVVLLSFHKTHSSLVGQ